MAKMAPRIHKLFIPSFYILFTFFLCVIVLNMIVKEPFIPTTLDHMSLRPNVQKQHCHYCFNTTDKIIIGNNNDICREEYLLVIIVVSHPANLDARKIIRKTWGNVTEFQGHKLKTVFMFGIHEDKNFNQLLLTESQTHGDVIQGAFTDGYKQLTAKSIVALKWASRYCKSAKYFLKTDDDSYNNPRFFARYLLNEARDPMYVGGYCFTVWPDRRKGSKWYVSPKLYPDAYYPVYCAGPGYVVSQKAAALLVKVSVNVSYMNMEDVFVTGMCRSVADLQYYQINGIQVTKNKLSDCDLATWVLNIHQIPPHDMQMLWDRMHKGRQKGACIFTLFKHITVTVLFVICWSLIIRAVLKHGT